MWINVGLYQSSVLSPLLFAIVTDTLTRQIRRKAPRNVVLLNNTREEADMNLEEWRAVLERRLRLSRSTTECLCIGHQKVKLPMKLG